MVTYTTLDFITAVKRVAHVPVSNNTFNSADFLALGDMQMRTKVAPMIASCRENYWLTTQDQTIDEAVNRYQFPSKALGSAIVDVKVRSGTNLIHLSRVEVSDLYSEQYTTRPAYCYYFEDATMRLLPSSLPGTLVMYYYRIPSQLILPIACAQISSIASTTLTCSSVPSDYASLEELDVVSQSPGFNVLMKDTSPVSVIGNNITFTEVPGTVSVGDYICPAGQSCVVQCPIEWVEVLVQATAKKIFEIQGYEKRAQMADATLKEMVNAAMSIVSPRTIESAKIISGGGSLLQQQTTGWRLPVRS